MRLESRLQVLLDTSTGTRQTPSLRTIDFATQLAEIGADIQLSEPDDTIPDDVLMPFGMQMAEDLPPDRLLVVNNRVGVALRIREQRPNRLLAVHVGQRDVRASKVYKLFEGSETVLGVSVSTPDQARAAVDAGADYLGVHTFYTATHPTGEFVGLDGLRRIKETVPETPIYAIGGITEKTIVSAIEAGADSFAVISAVTQSPNPRESVMRFVNIINPSLVRR